MTSIPLLITALIGGIFVYLLVTEKIALCGPFTTYVLLSFLPIILTFIVPLFIVSLLSTVIEKSLLSLTYLIICLQILTSTIFIFIRINVLPGSSLAKVKDTNKYFNALASGNRLLKYSIYGNLLYLSCALVIIAYWAIVNRDILISLLTHPLESLVTLAILPFFMIALPLMAIPIYVETVLGIIIITSFTILFLLLFIISINGIIRILHALKNIKNYNILYVIFLIIPIANVICMLHFYNLSEKELKNVYDF